MPEPSTPTRLRVAMDAVARARLVSLVPPVRGHVPSADEAYVAMGAIGVGLNRWTLRFADLPRPAVFLPKPGDEVTWVDVDVTREDLARAEAMASLLHVNRLDVLGTALCTGLSKLIGDGATHGPFEAPHGP